MAPFFDQILVYSYLTERYLNIAGFLLLLWAVRELRNAYLRLRYHELLYLLFTFIVPLEIRTLSNFVATFFYNPSDASLSIVSTCYQLSAAMTLFSTLGLYFTLSYSLSNFGMNQLDAQFPKRGQFYILLIFISVVSTFIIRSLTYTYDDATNRFLSELSDDPLGPLASGMNLVLVIWMNLAIYFLVKQQKQKIGQSRLQKANSILLLAIVLNLFAVIFSLLEVYFNTSILVLLQIDLILSLSSAIILSLTVVKYPRILIPNTHGLKFVYIRHDPSNKSHNYYLGEDEEADDYLKKLPDISLIVESQVKLNSRFLALEYLIAQSIYRDEYRIILISTTYHRKYEITASQVLDVIISKDLDFGNKDIMLPLLQEQFNYAIAR